MNANMAEIDFELDRRAKVIAEQLATITRLQADRDALLEVVIEAQECSVELSKAIHDAIARIRAEVTRHAATVKRIKGIA